MRTDASPPPGGLEPMLRLFIALGLPDQVKASLEALQAQLRAPWPANTARWTPVEQIHLTLRFLGEVPAAAQQELTAALARGVASVAPFRISVAGLGAFPNLRRPRVLWAGIGGELSALDHLRQTVLDATAPWGQLEEKAFHAHLTLARFRDLPPAGLRAVTATLAMVRVGSLGTLRVGNVALFASELRPSGALHRRLVEAPLRASGS